MACDFGNVFSVLPKSENPKQTSLDGIPYALHEDHRWLLPFAHFAQQNGLLPKPCAVVMFDRHHDALDPLRRGDEARKRLRAKPTLQGIASLCEQDLKKTDDDWLKAGMDLGLFGDAVVFGVDDVFDADNLRFYTDHLGCPHRVEIQSALPRSALAYQGHLSDLARRAEFEPWWKILGWSISGTGPFRFVAGLPKILLSIDLDCFAIPWSDYVFEWPTKVFEREFLEVSDYRSTADWTGRLFLQELVKKAGLVAIARESHCTGGSEDSESILRSLIKYGFDDRLSFEQP